MKKKASVFIYPLMMGLLIFSNSCEENNVNDIPVLTTVEVTEITATTAISGGDITDDGGTAITARGVCWSTNQTPSINDSKTTDGTVSGNFTSHIANLEPSTTYYVRAYATNSKGTGYGSAISFQTLEAINFPILTTTEITEITTKTAISGGNITDDGGAAITLRGICWSKNANPTIADNTTTDGEGTGSYVSRLAELTVGTTYYVRAYATNSNGTAYGSVATFKTLDEGGVTGYFTDSRDSTVYQTITIGDQVWMAENLKYLPSVVEPSTGSKTNPYYYVYDYEGTNVSDAKATANYNTYGVLYNWGAAITSCPAGWHLPSDAEWKKLINFFGGDSVAGNKLKETGTTHWANSNAKVTNESGFTALPGGYRDESGTFAGIGYDGYSGYAGYWWSADESDPNNAWFQILLHDNSNINRSNTDKESGFSIRCIKD